MTETAKTGAFLVVAIVAAAVGYSASRPSLPAGQKEDYRDHYLFPDFNKNPLDATSLEIVKYSKGDDRGQSGTVQRFQVVQKNNLYLIPSHANYPTDAKEQLGDAAKSLTDLKVLGAPPEGNSPAEDHKLYGLVDPEKAAAEIEGKATIFRVTMKDRNDKILLNLIIGNEVPGKPELHFVRKTDEDKVFEVRVATDKLSTEFGDWIEKGLLKGGSGDMAVWDIKDIQIRDHSVDEMQGIIIPRDEMTLAYNEAGDFKWKLAEDRQFQGKAWVPVKMAADEELNSEKVEAMKSAIENLEIVDVEAKPQGVSADLKVTGGLSKNRAVVETLANHGFFVVPMDGHPELFSNQGDVRCQLKDGVLYILRFGALASDSTAGKQKSGGVKAGTNRYIMVTALFNPDVIPQPKLEPLPEEKPEAQKPEGKAAGDKADAGKKADEKKPEAKKVDIKAERERIEKNNKRLQEEYDAKLQSGKKKVADLNARFADWFYIISDEVYHKIHLARADIVKKKEKDKGTPGAAHDHDEHEHDHEHEHDGAAAPEYESGPTALDKFKEQGPGK